MEWFCTKCKGHRDRKADRGGTSRVNLDAPNGRAWKREREMLLMRRFPVQTVVVPLATSLLMGYLWIIGIWRIVNIEYFSSGGALLRFAGLLLGPGCMLLVVGGTGVLLGSMTSKRLARRLPGPEDCQECGYSLRGLTPGERCPECGQPPTDGHLST